jgi:ribosomal protein S18 acetylase RimI-like enzyme
MVVACWGTDPRARAHGLEFVFATVLPALDDSLLIASQGGRIVGVLGMASPGTCRQLPLRPSLSALVTMVIRSPRAMRRFLQWMSAFERVHPIDPHWHLGPVAVDPDLQGRGIGSALLARFTGCVDESGGWVYLETDQWESARLYERFGFRIVREETILSTPNWFMVRPATSQGDRSRIPVGGT